MSIPFDPTNSSDAPSRPAGIGPVLPRVVQTSRVPPYAYGLLQAASLAQRLGLSSMSAVELGVAGGNGLLELERLSRTMGDDLGVAIDVAGFDLGCGMPDPVDYRDMPYIWQRGFFRMDEELVRSRLTSADLILGDIRETGRTFMAQHPAPLGFLSFDLDYYSSTRAAMGAFLNEESSYYLPRVFCYFDDMIGPHEELHSEFTGELLAIREFNEERHSRKLAKIHGLRYKLLPVDPAWAEGMYVLHIFDHSRYNDYVYHELDRQLPLESDTGPR
jgi:hypothetical protein